MLRAMTCVCVWDMLSEIALQAAATMLSSYPPDWWWVQEMLAQTQVHQRLLLLCQFLHFLVPCYTIHSLSTVTYETLRDCLSNLIPDATPGRIDQDRISKLPLLSSPCPLAVQQNPSRWI